MALDFYGVSLSGRIIQFATNEEGGDVYGGSVELWVDQQSSVLTKDLGALAFVSQVDVNLKMGENASITMVLTPPFEDGLRFMQSDLIRFGIGRLEVDIAYKSGTTTGGGATRTQVLPFSGFLQKPDVSIGNDITITLHALGVGYQMNIVGGVESSPFKEGISYAQAVEETLTKYLNVHRKSGGLKVDSLYKYVDELDQMYDPFFQPVTAETAAADEAKENPKPDANVVNGIIHKGPRNDWWFVKEVVQEYGYDLFIEGDAIFVVKKSFWIDNAFGQKGQRKQFLLRGVVDPERNMFPILSFSSPTINVWLQPGIGKTIAKDVDPSKQNDKGIEHEAAGDKTPIARGKDAPDPREEVAASLALKEEIAARLHPGDPSNEAVKKQLEAHWTDVNMQAGVTGEFTTLGIPDLTPGETVQVSGFEALGSSHPANALFNGVYGVTEVNHRVGVGGWETTFLGIQNVFQAKNIEGSKNAVRKILSKARIAEDLELLDLVHGPASVTRTAKK